MVIPMPIFNEKPKVNLLDNYQSSLSNEKKLHKTTAK